MNDVLRNALRVAGYESWGEISDAELVSVRRAAITEAVDRLTDAEIFDLVFAMTTARIPQGRELLRRALTEGT
jgi:DNA polymerase III delta subunit